MNGYRYGSEWNSTLPSFYHFSPHQGGHKLLLEYSLYWHIHLQFEEGIFMT